MSLLTKSIVVLQTFRYFHKTCTCYSESKAMRKILRGTQSNKKYKYVQSPILPTPNMFSKGAFEGKRSPNIKRVSVLNKLFMRHITDLMVSSDYADQYAGLGLEINRVQVTPDFNWVNVYWLSKGTGNDEKLEKLLEKSAYSIRHELTQLRVVGVMPRIQFIKDDQIANIVELDRRLAIADFGEDYVPADPNSKLKTEFQLQTKIEPHLKDQIEKLTCPEEDNDYEDPLPPMPQNVLGLNHEDIMHRVQKALKKSLAPHRTSDEELEPPHTFNNNPVEYSSHKAQNAAFKEFLRKRTIIQLKSEKDKAKYQPDLEYFKEEREKLRQEEIESFNFEQFYDEEDYYEEDDNK